MNRKSNAEPFPRALATLLLTAAAVCILSGSARAQLYIGQDGTSGIVGKYNANNGRTIKPNFITGLNTPDGLAVSATTSSCRTPATIQCANTTRKPER